MLIRCDGNIDKYSQDTNKEYARQSNLLRATELKPPDIRHRKHEHENVCYNGWDCIAIEEGFIIDSTLVFGGR